MVAEAVREGEGDVQRIQNEFSELKSLDEDSPATVEQVDFTDEEIEHDCEATIAVNSLDLPLPYVYEEMSRSVAVTSDAVSDLLVWPEDVIVVEKVLVGKDLDGSGMAERDVLRLLQLDRVLETAEPHVSDCLHVFFGERLVTWQKYDEYIPIKGPDVADGWTSACGQDVPENFKFQSEEAKSERRSWLREQRCQQITQWICAAKGFSGPRAEAALCDRYKRDKQLENAVSQSGHRLVVHCQSLSFALPQAEPYFCSLTLYDARLKKKLSENFYFDLNSEEMLQEMMSDHLPAIDPMTRSTHAIFNVSAPNPHIYLCLQVEVVLHTDPAAAIKPFADPKKYLKREAHTKLMRELAECRSRNGAHRQPLLWGAAAVYRLCEETGDLVPNLGRVCISKFQKVTSDIREPFDLADGLRDMKSKTDNGILGCLVMEVSEYSAWVQTNRRTVLILDPANNPADRLKPVPSSPPQSDCRSLSVSEWEEFEMPVIVRQIQEISMQPAAHTTFQHMMYVWPEAMNLVNRMWSPNVSVKVSMFKDDQLDSDGNLPDGELVFYSTSSSSSTLSTFRVTQVSHSCRTPQFHDEFKMRLPYQISHKHHLLFTVYNIQINKQRSKAEVLGYVIQPLLDAAGRITTGDYLLPLYTKLKSGYLDASVRSTLPTYDSGDGLFEFRTLVLSTIFPQDPNLLQFFHRYKLVECRIENAETLTQVATDLIEGVRTLRQVDAVSRIQYFPVYCNQILEMIAAMYRKRERVSLGAGHDHSDADSRHGSLWSSGGTSESNAWTEVTIEAFESLSNIIGIISGSSTASASSTSSTATNPNQGQQIRGGGASFAIPQSSTASNNNNNSLSSLPSFKVAPGSTNSISLASGKGNSIADESLSMFLFSGVTSLPRALRSTSTCSLSPAIERRAGVLDMYVSQLFDNGRMMYPDLHEAIAHAWLEALDRKSQVYKSQSEENNSCGDVSVVGKRGVTIIGNVPTSSRASAGECGPARLRSSGSVVGSIFMYENLVENSWFFFDLIIKSLSLHRKSPGNGVAESSVVSGCGFLVMLQKLCMSLTEATCVLYNTAQALGSGSPDSERLSFLASRLNCDLTLFVRDLFALVDKDTVFFIIQKQLRVLWAEDALLFAPLRLDMMTILCDYQLYVPLNLPLPLVSIIGRNVDTDSVETERLLRHHFLAGAMLQQTQTLLSLGSKDIQQATVAALFQLISKHEHDSRYQSAEKRARIATMYFPLIEILLPFSWTSLDATPSQDELLACVAFVLANVPSQLLRGWWRHQTNSIISSFLSLLSKISKSFFPDPATTPAPCKGHASTTLAVPAAAETGNADIMEACCVSESDPSSLDSYQMFHSTAVTSPSTPLTDSNAPLEKLIVSPTPTALDAATLPPPSPSSSSSSIFRRSKSTPTGKKAAANLPTKPSEEEERQRQERERQAEMEKRSKVCSEQRLSHSVALLVISVLSDLVDDLISRFESVDQSPPVVSDIWELLLFLIGRGVKQERESPVIPHRYTMRVALPCLFDLCASLAPIAPPDFTKFKSLLYLGLLCESSSDEIVAGAARVLIEGLTEMYVAMDGDSLEGLGDLYDDDNSSVVFAPDTDESGQNKNIVMYATVAKLVHRLTLPNLHDISYTQDFFITYRTFMSPSQLLKLIMRLWGEPSDDKEPLDLRVSRLRLGNALNYWLEKHFEDFCFWNLSNLLRFVSVNLVPHHRPTLDKILKMVRKKILMTSSMDTFLICSDTITATVPPPSGATGPMSTDVPPQQPPTVTPAAPLLRSDSSLSLVSLSPTISTPLSLPTPPAPTTAPAPSTPLPASTSSATAGWPLLQMFSFTNISVEDARDEPTGDDREVLRFGVVGKRCLDNLENIDAELLARHLTFIEFEMFSKIRMVEFLDKNWTKKNREEMAPNIVAMTARFNEVSMWVATVILNRELAKERRRLLSKFIDVAWQCKEMNNFNGVFEILSGLANSAVHRLKKTWELSQHRQQQYDELLRLTSRDENFKELKETLNKLSPPAIPYLGVFQTYLTFIEDGNSDVDSSTGLINFSKRRQVSTIISRMQVWQQKPYGSNGIATELLDALHTLESKSDDNLFQLSLLREPR